MSHRNVLGSLAVLGCGLAIAACSSSGGTASKATVTTTAPSTSPSTAAAAPAASAASGAVDCAAINAADDAVSGNDGVFSSFKAEATAISNAVNVTALQIGKVDPAAASAYKTQLGAALASAGDGPSLNDVLTGTLASVGNSTGVNAQLAQSCP